MQQNTLFTPMTNVIKWLDIIISLSRWSDILVICRRKCYKERVQKLILVKCIWSSNRLLYSQWYTCKYCKGEVCCNRKITQDFHCGVKPTTIYFRYDVKIYVIYKNSPQLIYFAEFCNLPWNSYIIQALNQFPKKKVRNTFFKCVLETQYRLCHIMILMI